MLANFYYDLKKFIFLRSQGVSKVGVVESVTLQKWVSPPIRIYTICFYDDKMKKHCIESEYNTSWDSYNINDTVNIVYPNGNPWNATIIDEVKLNLSVTGVFGHSILLVSLIVILVSILFLRKNK